MINERREAQNEMEVVMIEQLVPQDHLLRKIDKYIAISSQLNSLVFSNKLDDNTVIILLDKLLIELNYFDSLKKYNK